jgi:hypothetical protein
VVHRAHLRDANGTCRSALVLGALRSQQARNPSHRQPGAYLEQAKAEFEASWKQWKVWAGMERLTDVSTDRCRDCSETLRY